MAMLLLKLFNDVVSATEVIHCQMKLVSCIGSTPMQNLERSGCGLFPDTTLTIAWRSSQETTSTRRAGNPKRDSNQVTPECKSKTLALNNRA